MIRGNWPCFPGTVSFRLYAFVVGDEDVVCAGFLSMPACESGGVVWQYFKLPVVCKIYEGLAIGVGEVARLASYVPI